MQFILMGFSHDLNYRVFKYEGVEDRVRTGFTVRADLAMTRKYGIRLQELPLLCQAVLEKLNGAVKQRALTYTEADMVEHAREVRQRQDDAGRKGRRRPSALTEGQPQVTL
jgi:hypothetical protein